MGAKQTHPPASKFQPIRFESPAAGGSAPAVSIPKNLLSREELADRYELAKAGAYRDEKRADYYEGMLDRTPKADNRADVLMLKHRYQGTRDIKEDWAAKLSDISEKLFGQELKGGPINTNYTLPDFTKGSPTHIAQDEANLTIAEMDQQIAKSKTYEDRDLDALKTLEENPEAADADVMEGLIDFFSGDAEMQQQYQELFGDLRGEIEEHEDPSGGSNGKR